MTENTSPPTAPSRHSTSPAPQQPDLSAQPQAVQHGATTQPPDRTSVKTYDIENQSLTGSSASSAPDDKENGIRQALQTIKRALHIKESPYTYRHRLKNKIRPLDSYQPGYSTLAAIENSDPNFLIYRKFGWLRNRLLLDLQDELVTLEEELERLDANDNRLCDPEGVLISRRNDELEQTLRRGLLKKIRQKLSEYDEVLLHLIQVQAIRRPTVRNQNSLYRLIWNNTCQAHEEMDWIYRREDLAALARDTEHGWFNGFVEDTLHAISRTMTTFIFRDGYRKERTGNVKVTLLSQKRLEIFLRAIFVLLTTILFLVPVFILLRLQPSYQDEVRHKENLQLVTILAFTLTFSASCSIFTKAKRQEVFMATGAYCAVLVVFLGNTQNAIINNAMEAPRFQSHPTGVNLVGQLARDPSLTA